MKQLKQNLFFRFKFNAKYFLFLDTFAHILTQICLLNEEDIQG